MPHKNNYKILPKDFIICSDFDDTINNLLNAWIEALNKAHGTQVRYDDIHSWNMQKAFPTLTEEQICAPLKSRIFWKTVDIKPDAAIYINKLINEGFQFYIVTASHYSTLSAKIEECLLKYFPNFDVHNIITTYNKGMINCDVIIDDYIPNLENSKAIKILMNAPHNQNSNNIEHFRVSSWKEIYDIVHELINIFDSN